MKILVLVRKLKLRKQSNSIIYPENLFVYFKYDHFATDLYNINAYINNFSVHLSDYLLSFTVMNVVVLVQCPRQMQRRNKNTFYLQKLVYVAKAYR